MNITPPAFNHTPDEGEYREDDDDYESDSHGRVGKFTEHLFSAFGFLLIGCMIGVSLFLIGYVYLKRIRRPEKTPTWMKKLRRTSSLISIGSDQSTVPKTRASTEALFQHQPLMEMTSGSGSGAMTLNQRTIAMDLTMLGVVARGRYGEVQKALYRGSIVAVKTFYTTEEDSWRNERDIYQTQMLNHENILQYVAADIASNTDSMTQMMLITDFHPLGSLYDYLHRVEYLELSEAMEIALSTISGIEHLHNAVRGTGSRRKPEIAHRDIKSKNVIVKRLGVCCIADFGLAVRCEDGELIPPNVNILTGTKRYMSPEVLSRRLNPRNFNEFKASDIYSYALVLWEVMNRVQITKPITMIDEEDENEENDEAGGNENESALGETGFGQPHQLLPASYSSSSGIATGSVELGGTSSIAGASSALSSQSSSADGRSSVVRPLLSSGRVILPCRRKPTLALLRYQTQVSNEYNAKTQFETANRPYELPYEGLVDNDPSFEQMRRVVVDQRLRPAVDPKWIDEGSNTTMKQLCELMCECWSGSPQSRHTSLKVKKELISLVAAGRYTH